MFIFNSTYHVMLNDIEPSVCGRNRIVMLRTHIVRLATQIKTFIYKPFYYKIMTRCIDLTIYLRKEPQCTNCMNIFFFQSKKYHIRTSHVFESSIKAF